MSEMDVSTEGNDPSEDHQEVPTPPAVECNDSNVTAEKVSPKDGANLTDNFDLLADFDLLGEKYNELCVLNEEIMNLMLLETEMNPADLDAETFAADEYNKKFKRINIIFKSKSNNREESDNSSSVQSISKRKFKLPLLELKKFGGEIKDWLPFWVKDNPKIYSLKKPMHTAAGLFAGSQSSSNCAFCNEKNHESKNCKLALNLDLQEKTTLLAKKKCCYRCFKTGHMVRQCTNKIKCSQCQRRHYNVMCPELKPVVSTGSDKLVDKAVENSNGKFNTLANPTCSADVLLQTLVVYLYGNDGSFPVRALIDTGSQKSYITKEAVSKMSYEPIRAEDMIHNLFGGVESKQKHHLYKVYASSFQKDYHCSFEAYDQEKICIDIPTAISGPWTKEIEKKGIFLSDKEACLDYSASSVHLLIGADIAGATLNHLLDGAPDCYKMTAQHLQKSMYVDNCVASVKSEADLTKFINESREIMALGKFELRGWQHNSLSP
ncbi:integrase core domain protein [Caerostris darwini]|uniref:Integrase core domain protein n=1 Tax=Caerostris darwini TaxID=1538125 RepID=A0AAV4UK65_9ARAC|nr:integrase core domain protein [Caerostris darwini]